MPFEPLPLSARFDLHHRAGEEDLASNWSMVSRDGTPVSMGLPAYSRITSDGDLDATLRDSLLACFGNYGIPWLDQTQATSSSTPLRIATLAPDAPIEAERLVGCSAVQFRFFGSSTHKINPGSLSYWKPIIPPELFRTDQLAKKVEAVRSMFFGKLPIGAATVMQSSTIYEDIRFLIDCGFDFLELLATVQHDLRSGARIAFDPDAKASVSRAIDARRDAKSSCRFWLSASCLRAEDWVDWMRMGIDACCLDGYLASQRPTAVESVGSFAGIKVPSVSKHDWIRDAVRELQTSILDTFKFYSQ